MNFINIYFNYLAFQNNIILNFLIIMNIFFPILMKQKIIFYKKKGDEYFNYILLLSLNNEIEEKYHINILNIGLSIRDYYKKIMTNNVDTLSDISDLSDIGHLSDDD